MSQDYVEYRCIDSRKKTWHVINSIEFAQRGRASNYVTAISYAESRVTQNGFVNFNGEEPAISIYKFIGNSTFKQMKLKQVNFGRDIKYILTEDKNILYAEYFDKLSSDDIALESDNEAHNSPTTSPLKTPQSIKLTPPPLQQSYTNVTVRSKSKFTIDSCINSPTVLNFIHFDEELEESPDLKTYHPFGEKSGFVSNSSSVNDASNSPKHFKTPPPKTSKPVTIVGSKQNHSTSGNSSFLFMCAELKPSLGKFAALASLLGWLGLVVSTYGTALFYTAGALAVSGALVFGICLFRTGRPEVAEPKQRQSYRVDWQSKAIP